MVRVMVRVRVRVRVMVRVRVRVRVHLKVVGEHDAAADAADPLVGVITR